MHYDCLSPKRLKTFMRLLYIGEYWNNTSVETKTIFVKAKLLLLTITNYN